MSDPGSLVIVHYHLLPGGVCSAVKNSLVALSQSGWLSQRSVKILTGRTAGIDEFRVFLKQRDLKVQIEVDPRLDYSERVWPNRNRFWQEASGLANWFLQQASGTSLFWAHNPTLGKNALVTAGLMAAAKQAVASGIPHQFFYHIHDFAECGRLWNLAHLRRCWGDGGLDDFYPVCKNVGYGVLNKADSERLGQAGIPKESIFVLPNAVPLVRTVKGKDKESIGKYLQSYARAKGYQFEYGRPWWTLPIRLIRRKNVVEALLLAAIAEDAPQLLITLDANSEPERPYAEAVKDLFRKERHAAVVGFGHELVGPAFSFDDLLLASDVVVSTSLLEGFGFTFLEGANRGRPLVGRNLRDVTSDFVDTGFPASALYDEFLVPIDGQTRMEMINKGQRFAQEQGKLLRLKHATIERFSEEVRAIFANTVVDFGFLDLSQQIQITRLLRGESLPRDLKLLNSKAMEPAEFPPNFPERVEEHFGLESHAARLTATFEHLFGQENQEEKIGNVSDRLLDLYFRPRFHRPLIGGW
ncbi:MAG: hypothetical protein LJE89_08525 [Deltaproteobacteria bacterium]|nr:hypothetical protein [Deltaproteobacteria bacterium]